MIDRENNRGCTDYLDHLSWRDRFDLPDPVFVCRETKRSWRNHDRIENVRLSIVERVYAVRDFSF